MSVIRNSVVIQCKREDAFDYLSDHRAELEWNPKCTVMEKVTDGPAGLGTRYQARWKGSPFIEMETVAYDRPRAWTMHNGGPLDVTFTCRLEPVPEGTRLDAEFEPRPHGWFRLLFPIYLLVGATPRGRQHAPHQRLARAQSVFSHTRVNEKASGAGYSAQRRLRAWRASRMKPKTKTASISTISPSSSHWPWLMKTTAPVRTSAVPRAIA